MSEKVVPRLYRSPSKGHEQCDGYKNWNTYNVVYWLKSDPSLQAKAVAKANERKSKIKPAEVQKWINDSVFPNGTPSMLSYKELSPVKWGEVTEYINSLRTGVKSDPQEPAY